jgi:hypothetical protein
VVPVTFSTITPDTSIDIATPFPLKISRLLDIPVSRAGSILLENFHIDGNYLLNTTEDLFYRGFLNFRLSRLLIFRSVYETCMSEIPSTSTVSVTTPDVIHKIQNLLQRNFPTVIPSFDQFIIPAMKCAGPEFEVSRLIAVSGEDAVHSSGARTYFRNRLIAETQLYYKSCPINLKDSRHSLFRIIILKALFNRIQTQSGF